MASMAAILDIWWGPKTIGMCRFIGLTSPAKMVTNGEVVLEIMSGMRFQDGGRSGHIGYQAGRKNNSRLWGKKENKIKLANTGPPDGV